MDAYPEATVTGTVFLSAFTTKVAVYALARGYAGTEILITIGAVMTFFPIFFAVIENDLRRVLAYSMNNQLGFMVVGIGIGTDLALNGAVAHAFADILFKGLLFMSMGAVLYRVGTDEGLGAGRTLQVHALDHGLLHRRRSLDLGLPAVQRLRHEIDDHHGCHGQGLFLALADHAVRQRGRGGACRHQDPLLRVLRARLRQALRGGTRQHADCDGHRGDVVHRHRHVSRHTSTSCCPINASYNPFTLDHVVAQIQLLLFASLAVAVMIRTGIYPPELRSTNLDVDWL